ncbi:hypothetical protein ACFL0R_01065 [Pseudomonadota bacterium]
MKLDGMSAFLTDYPGMSLQPTRNGDTKICGLFQFKAKGAGEEIEDTFELEILLDSAFPCTIPKVRETAGSIPNTGDYHVNPDGTLCLGSPLRLKKALFDSPDLVSFAEKCLVPYLFSVSIKIRNGGKFITGELPHGTAGIIHDYMEMLGLNTIAKVAYALNLMGTKKRIANKKTCPCGCGLRLGRCPLHYRLNALRPAASRAWFRMHAQDIETNSFG